MNNSHLAELEDDIQQQLARTEERVRAEVSAIPAVFIVDYCSCDSLDYLQKFQVKWIKIRQIGYI